MQHDSGKLKIQRARNPEEGRKKPKTMGGGDRSLAVRARRERRDENGRAELEHLVRNEKGAL